VGLRSRRFLPARGVVGKKTDYGKNIATQKRAFESQPPPFGRSIGVGSSYQFDSWPDNSQGGFKPRPYGYIFLEAKKALVTGGYGREASATSLYLKLMR